MRDSTSRPALSSVQPKTTSESSSSLAEASSVILSCTVSYLGIRSDPGHMGSAHVNFWLANVFREGPVYACKIASLSDVSGSNNRRWRTPRRTSCSMTADPVPPQPTTETRRSLRICLDFAAEGANVPVELLRGRLCLVKPIPGERESPAGYPQTIDVVAAVVRFDVTGETETSPGPGKDHCSIPGAPRAEPEEVGELLVDGFVMPARSGR